MPAPNKVGFTHVIKTTNKLHLLNKKASVSSDISNSQIKKL
jgi:hypothetical protein